MSWTVPEKVELTMLHTMRITHEPGLMRSRARETSCVVQRPEHGESRVSVECNQCGRQGMFVIYDRETTKRLRRGSVLPSVVASMVMLATATSLWVIGFGGGNILCQVLAFPATLLFGTWGIYLIISPSSKLGIEAPEVIFFGADTVRRGLATTHRSGRGGQGLSCGGHTRRAP